MSMPLYLRALLYPVFLPILLAACGSEQVLPVDAASQDARDAMVFSILTQHRTGWDSVHVASFERATFPNACLGIPIQNACTQVQTQGYRLSAEIRGRQYEYRAPAGEPTRVLLAEGPPLDFRPALVWQDAEPACQNLLIGPAGQAAIGPCDAPHVEIPLIKERERLAEWHYFYERFRPFTREDDAHSVTFTGAGTEEASPAWRQAVLNWATLQWAELYGGRSGAAYGRLLSAGRAVEGRPGHCYVLEVTNNGAALLSTSLCGGGGGEGSQSGWLSDAQ